MKSEQITKIIRVLLVSNILFKLRYYYLLHLAKYRAIYLIPKFFTSVFSVTSKLVSLQEIVCITSLYVSRSLEIHYDLQSMKHYYIFHHDF